MKYLFVMTMIILTATVSLWAGEQHLFILSGQSNMTDLNPAVSFIPTIQKEFGPDNVIVVKSDKGSQPIRMWYKKWRPAEGKKNTTQVTVDNDMGENGALYKVLMQAVSTAIEGKSIKTVTLIWMQGERDAMNSDGEVYGESFKGLVAQLSEDFDRKNINFVIGRLSDYDMSNNKRPHWTLIREIQVKIANESPNGAWVDTDDLNGDRNALHYTKEGSKELGKRFAEKAIKLIRN